MMTHTYTMKVLEVERSNIQCHGQRKAIVIINGLAIERDGMWGVKSTEMQEGNGIRNKGKWDIGNMRGE